MINGYDGSPPQRGATNEIVAQFPEIRQMCHSFTVTDDDWDSRAPAAINQAAGEARQNNRVPTEEQKERVEEEEDLLPGSHLILEVTLVSGSREFNQADDNLLVKDVRICLVGVVRVSHHLWTCPQKGTS